MDLLKDVQQLLPWLTALPAIPKFIVTSIVIGAAAFLLSLIWTPPPETAVKEILAGCFNRALITRMNIPEVEEAMFASLDDCRKLIQKKIPEIHRSDLQSVAVDLLAAIDAIGRRNPIESAEDTHAIDQLKLYALSNVRMLALATGEKFAFAHDDKFGGGPFFTEEEVVSAPKPTALTNPPKSNH